jgi:hypothetical protein
MPAGMESPPQSTPDSVALLRSTQRRRAVPILVAVLAAGGLAAGAYYIAGSVGSGWDEVGTAYDALNTCMIGAPLAEGESVAMRMTGIELALRTMSPSERAERASDWPIECKPMAHKLAEAVRGSARKDAEPLAAAATELANELDMRKPDAPAATYEKLRAAAKAVSLEAKVAADVKQPPAPKPRPSLDLIPATARLSEDGFNPGHLHLEPFQSRDTFFLLDEENLKGGPRLCDYRPKSKELVCEKLPEKVAKNSPHLRLWGTTEPGAAPFLFVGDRGQDGIYRSSNGKRVGKKLIYGAHAGDGDHLVATWWNEKEGALFLAELRPDEKKPESVKLLDYAESGNPYYHTGLFWNWFVYRDFDDKKDLHLYAREVKGLSKWGELVDVGPLVEPGLIRENDTPHFDACRDGDTIVIRARGLSVDRLAFHDNKGWHTPVPSPGIAGTLTCFGGEAVITQLDNRTVYENRCTATGCERAEFSLDKALSQRESLKPSADDPVTAAAAGPSLAVAWRAPGEGLRLVVGRAADIAKNEGTLILDDKIHKGQVSQISTLTHYRLIPGRGYALLILTTIDGNYVEEVLPDGTLTPVTVKQ